jgi:hypothetical protein
MENKEENIENTYKPLSLQDKMFAFFSQHGVPSLIAISVLYEMHLFFVKITQDLTAIKVLTEQIFRVVMK